VEFAAAVQLGLPEDVFAFLGVPGERQVFLVAVALAGGAAPAGPVARNEGAGDAEQQGDEQSERPGGKGGGGHERILLKACPMRREWGRNAVGGRAGNRDRRRERTTRQADRLWLPSAQVGTMPAPRSDS